MAVDHTFGKGCTTHFVEYKINRQKAKFGVDIFEIFMKMLDATNTKLDDIAIESFKDTNALDLLIQNRKVNMTEFA